MPSKPTRQLSRQTPLQTPRQAPDRDLSAAGLAAIHPQFERALESVPDAILIIDGNWNFIYANQKAITLLHSGPLVGENIWQLFPGTREEPFLSAYTRTMQQRIPAEFEAFYSAPLHSWYRVSIRPFDTAGIVIFFSDITQQRAAEERRDEFANRLTEVFEVTEEGVVILDREWRFTFLNRRARELLAPAAADLEGQDLWTSFPAIVGTHVEHNYRRTMDERVPTAFPNFYPEPLNLWLDIEARPADEGILIFFRDVTARRQAELTRDRNASLLEQVLASTNDGVLSLDRDWRITYLNRHGREIVGAYTEINGRTLWELFPEAVGSEFDRNYRLSMEKRAATNFVAFYPAPLNTWFNVNAQPSDDGITVFFRDITGDYHAAEAIREQQTQLAFVQQSTGVATWELDLRSREITFGAGSASIFGHPLAEIGSTRALRRIIHPESLAYHPSLAELAAFPDRTHLREYRLTAADGSTRWVESRSRAILTGGVATHLRGVAIDITARKRNDEALRESERRYRVLVDLNPQALWIGDPAGRITYANQGFLDYLGFDLSQLDRWLDAFYPGDRDRVLAAWTHSVQTGEPYNLEACLYRRDGVSRLWHLNALPVRDDAGHVVQWLGVATDIHDARNFAETLRLQQLETERERAELEAIYQTAPIGLALFDPVDFRYLRLNHRQAAFFGLPPEQILGQTLTEMAPIPGLYELFEQVAQGRPVINHILEGELATHPGEHRVWSVNYLPVHAPDGSVQAISTASIEITQQRRAEAAIIQSEKLAAVGRLASSISHEINNPLEAITNLLYLVAQHDGLPPDLKVYVNMAQSELARVSQIATQTLRFHRQAVKPTLVTAAQLVNAVLNLYQGRLANSGIRTDLRYDSDTPIHCFENDIRQVLNNLIANAIDAMRTGGRLIVRAHDGVDHPTGRRGLRIVIADTGHGMGRVTLSRLFEPFFTTKDLNGTGLGLWISKDIVDRHHGRLTVRSTQNTIHKGTIFSLFLPARQTPDREISGDTPQHEIPEA